MSTSLLYHAFGIRGYQHVSHSFYEGAIHFHIHQDGNSLRCPACRSYEVRRKGVVRRQFRTVSIGLKPVWIHLAVQRVWCLAGGALRQVRVGVAPERRSYTHTLARGQALEFWRDYFTDAEPRHPRTPFAVILREGLVQLVQRYRGKYNFLLTNGQVIWAFTNHRQFLMLKGSEKLKDALLLTTIEDGLSSENWQKLAARDGRGGWLLLIAGGDLVLSQTCSPEATRARRLGGGDAVHIKSTRLTPGSSKTSCSIWRSGREVRIRRRKFAVTSFFSRSLLKPKLITSKACLVMISWIKLNWPARSWETMVIS